MTSGTAEAVKGTAADRRNARLYLIGLATSMLGDSAMSLVAGIWVKSLTGSSSLAGLVSACVYLPSLFGPVGGVIADRVHRQRLLIRLNIASALVLLGLLAVRSAAGVWIIFVVMTWYGIVLMVTGPAESALFAEMLPLEIRQRVNGWQLGLQETGRLVAPLAGAGLFALAGGGVVAAADAATFAVAAVMTARLRLRPRDPQPRAASHWRADLLAGFAHIGQTPVLRRVLAAGAGVMALSAIVVAAQFSLVEAVGQRPAFLGVFSAGLGGGSIVASLVSSRVLRRTGEEWLAIFGMFNFAVGTALRATGMLVPALIGTVVLGFALPWVFLAVLNLAQRLTPLSLQGRVSAAVALAMFGPQAPLQALGSLAIRYASYRQLYLATAAAALLWAAYLLRPALATRKGLVSPGSGVCSRRAERVRGRGQGRSRTRWFRAGREDGHA
ncbi:MAG TPA: MFS transporter [Streptosporangiaceae bacterium]